jgi:predicted RNA-binding protein YlqC (UPF0109 family)
MTISAARTIIPRAAAASPLSSIHVEVETAADDMGMVVNQAG